MVIDTSDTAIWVEGSLSLASEELALRAVVMPKDFSPLTLRSPLRVTGTFADPSVSIDKAPLGKKLGTAFLLALANPLAALIPLIDGGDTKAAQHGAAGCKSVLQKAGAKRV
jgi:AsmA family protein